MQRYSIIENKNKREIVLLMGSGCKYKKCSFCDYHFDSSDNEELCFNTNKAALDMVDGRYNHLEVINSGSFVDLDENTINYIIKTCLKNNINLLHFECHYIHRNAIADFKERFKKHDITVKIKIGVESFDYNFRENVLKKGIKEKSPLLIARDFDEVCLLQGITGQTEISMLSDIKTGLKYFERVCINIMNENTTPIKPDKSVISIFKEKVMPLYMDDPKVDILINNTDFGVGE